MNTPQEVAEALSKAGAIVAASHINPDGDSVGSLLALSIALKGMGREVLASLPEPGSYPPQYGFLPGRELLSMELELTENIDVFIALDCSNLERLGPLRPFAERSSLLINVDHHEDNSYYGALNLVDPDASSTSELIFKVFKAGEWEMDADSATCLYTGLLTDTGRFQHRNTSPETFIIAADLASTGADIFRAASEIYENESLSYTRLLGLALLRARLLETYGLVYSYITRKDLEETGAILAETEDMIDHLRAVRGAKLVALFKETDDGRVRVSLRTREDHQVGPIARVMGGGGHAMAAGYTSDLGIGGSIEALLAVLKNNE